MSASPAPHDSPLPLDLRTCRQAARSVRASPYWRQVRDVVRPHGVSIQRSRPPLALLLYAAARDGRLVWRTAGEFAVLEPPIARMRDWAGSAAGRTWLARLSRCWEQLVWGGVPLALMVLAVPIAFVPAVGLAAAMLLILFAVTWVLAQMVVGLVRAVRHFRVSPDDSARSLHWTVTLCQVTDPAHLDRLLRSALDRSRDLATAHVRPDVADGTHVLMCLERGITTLAAREAAATAPSVVHADPDRTGVLVVRDGGPFQPPDPEAQRPLSVVPVLLSAVTVMVAAQASFVADAEENACRAAPDCAGRPATWLDALFWLLSRMVFQDNGLVAASRFGQWIGFTMPLLGVVVALCLAVAGRRHVRYVQRRRDLRYQDVVVSEYVQNVDHRRVTPERTLWRGERVQASRTLLTAFRAATHGWTGPRVHVGTVLSANVLSDSATFRGDLRREFPEASAGEMELTGLYAAAANHGCGWIMAKGISDWGAGGLTDATRQAASEAAATFIVRAITYGAIPVAR